MNDPTPTHRALYLASATVERLAELAARFDDADGHFDRVLIASRLIGVLHAAGLPIEANQ